MTIGFFASRFVDGESSIGRCVAVVDAKEQEELMARKAKPPQTCFGDYRDPEQFKQSNVLTRRF